MLNRILITAIVLVTGLIAFAQQGLDIDKYFNENFVTTNGLNYTNVSNEQLKDWNGKLTLYRAIQFKNNSNLADEIQRSVMSDGTKATTRTVSMANGILKYGFYVLPQVKDIYRYIIIMRKQSTETKQTETNLFYIEGRVTPEDFASVIKSI